MTDSHMHSMHWGRLAILFATLALINPPAIRGQVVEEAAEAAEEAAEAAEEAAEAAEGIVVRANMIQLGQNQVDHWVFGRQRLIQNRPGNNHRQAMSDGLQLQLDVIESATALSQPQRTKLEFAGRGDIERFMDRYEAFVRECPTGPVTQEKYVELNQKAQPLARRYGVGVHGEGSLFRKVLRSTLEADQLAQLDALDAERKRMRHQAYVKATVAMIDQKIPLTADQRKRLIDVTMSATTPPETAVEGHYKYHAVLYQMSQIPEQQIRPIFAEDEWRAFQAVMQQGQMVRGMIQRAGVEEFE